MCRLAIVRYVVVVISAVFLNIAFAGSEFTANANRIQETFDTQFYRLSPEKQSHYALRMYRVFGNEDYLYSVLMSVLLQTNKLKDYFLNMDDREFRMAIVKNRIHNIPGSRLPDARKDTLRKAVLENSDDLSFYLTLLLMVDRLNEYGLDIPDKDRFIDTYRNYDFRSYLLEENFIRAWGIHVPSYIHALYKLGIDDLREDFNLAFLQIFPDDKDDELSAAEYADKIYILTHIVISTSSFYQYFANEEEVAWIIDYFEDNLDRILADTKPDIVAEVGISFLLAKRNNVESINKIRNYTIEHIDDEHNMILSTEGDSSLFFGEHRNILAIMLLNWPDELALHPGPNLSDMSPYKQYLPDFLVAYRTAIRHSENIF